MSHFVLIDKDEEHFGYKVPGINGIDRVFFNAAYVIPDTLADKISLHNVPSLDALLHVSPDELDRLEVVVLSSLDGAKEFIFVEDGGDETFGVEHGFFDELMPDAG